MGSPEDLDPEGLYHLVTAAELERYRRTGLIDPPSLQTEGFVHCSWGRQVPGTVAKHFAGATDMFALRLDPALDGELTVIEEDSYGSGQRFPHVYGAIPVSAAVGAVAL